MQRLEPEGMTAAIGPDFLDRGAEKAGTDPAAPPRSRLNP